MVHIIRSTCSSISSAVKMKFTIVTTVLLGLLLTPALADYFQSTDVSKEIIIAEGSQILTINTEWRVATIEQQSTHGSWKTIWNYDMGVIASKVVAERACFISLMNRDEMPSFNALPRMSEESRNLKGQGQPVKEVTFVIQRPVYDLMSYGPHIFAMCRGLTTYLAYELHGLQSMNSQGSCIRLGILQILGFNYCRANIKA